MLVIMFLPIDKAVNSDRLQYTCIRMRSLVKNSKISNYLHLALADINLCLLYPIRIHLVAFVLNRPPINRLLNQIESFVHKRPPPQCKKICHISSKDIGLCLLLCLWLLCSCLNDCVSCDVYFGSTVDKLQMDGLLHF